MECVLVQIFILTSTFCVDIVSFENPIHTCWGHGGITPCSRLLLVSWLRWETSSCGRVTTSLGRVAPCCWGVTSRCRRETARLGWVTTSLLGVAPCCWRIAALCRGVPTLCRGVARLGRICSLLRGVAPWVGGVTTRLRRVSWIAHLQNLKIGKFQIQKYNFRELTEKIKVFSKYTIFS